MPEDDRVNQVQRLILEHLKSPSLCHIRDAYAVNKLAHDIVRKLDRGNPLWQKWEGPRDALAKAAATSWIPVEDLTEFLNMMAGPRLTTTDVEQRLRAFHEESYASCPNEELQAGCLAIYTAEKAEGTDMPAIVGLLQEHVEREEERLRVEHDQRWRKRAEDDRIALEQRFLSGADCKWTPLKKSKELYCRINGRTYQLSPTTDKMWTLRRIASVDDEDGLLIGKYRYRRDVTKVLAEVAYKEEAWR